MEALALDHVYRYDQPSALADQRLYLATSSLEGEHPHFSEGLVRHPRSLGMLLVSLTDVVRTHYFQPRPVLFDPVITSNEDMVRLEGFSGCCGVYARVDLPAGAFEADLAGRGTTNVDFNAPMRAALTRVSDADEVRLSVGREGVRLHTGREEVVEKKVRLPLRWIKRFGEVVAFQARLEPVHELGASETRRFLRSLPVTSPPKQPSWVVRTGRAVRLSQRAGKGAVPVVGVHRLASLLPLASGEWERPLARVRAQLRWQSELDADALGAESGLDAEGAHTVLQVLGTRGLVGFDAVCGRYYHRELPFDLDLVEAMQPRLKGARVLVESGGVAVAAARGDGAWDVDVRGTCTTHRVRLRPEGDRCTCPWFARHQGSRGPCKHVLAARLVVEEA